MRTLEDQHLIDQLRRELRSYKSKLSRREEEILRLKDVDRKYKQAIKAKSKYKRKAEKLKEQLTGVKPPTRCQKALALIERRYNGEDLKLVDIAKEVGLAYSTVKGLARDYKKAAES